MTSEPPHIRHLDDIAQEDAAGLRRAEEQYGSSWMQRGGVGAFMMLARKWDRIERAVRPRILMADIQEVKEQLLRYLDDAACEEGPDLVKLRALLENMEHMPWDIFKTIQRDERAEGIIDDIRDLRRYLMLVEALMRERGVPAAQTRHRDNCGGEEPTRDYVDQD